jgi:hypothetical protein
VATDGAFTRNGALRRGPAFVIVSSADLAQQ